MYTYRYFQHNFLALIVDCDILNLDEYLHSVY